MAHLIDLHRADVPEAIATYLLPLGGGGFALVDPSPAARSRGSRRGTKAGFELAGPCFAEPNAVMSALWNTTSFVAMRIPAVRSWAETSGIAPSKVMDGPVLVRRDPQADVNRHAWFATHARQPVGARTR